MGRFQLRYIVRCVDAGIKANADDTLSSDLLQPTMHEAFENYIHFAELMEMNQEQLPLLKRLMTVLEGLGTLESAM